MVSPDPEVVFQKAKIDDMREQQKLPKVKHAYRLLHFTYMCIEKGHIQPKFQWLSKILPCSFTTGVLLKWVQLMSPASDQTSCDCWLADMACQNENCLKLQMSSLRALTFGQYEQCCHLIGRKNSNVSSTSLGVRFEKPSLGALFSSIFDNSYKNNCQALLWLLLRGSKKAIITPMSQASKCGLVLAPGPTKCFKTVEVWCSC